MSAYAHAPMVIFVIMAFCHFSPAHFESSSNRLDLTNSSYTHIFKSIFSEVLKAVTYPSHNWMAVKFQSDIFNYFHIF